MKVNYSVAKDTLKSVCVLLKTDSPDAIVQITRETLDANATLLVANQHLELKLQELESNLNTHLTATSEYRQTLADKERMIMECKSDYRLLENNLDQIKNENEQLRKKNEKKVQLETPKPRKRPSVTRNDTKKRKTVKVESDVVFY